MQYFIFVLMRSVNRFAAHSLADEVDEYSANIQSFDEYVADLTLIDLSTLKEIVVRQLFTQYCHQVLSDLCHLVITHH